METNKLYDLDGPLSAERAKKQFEKTMCDLIMSYTGCTKDEAEHRYSEEGKRRRELRLIELAQDQSGDH